MSAIARKGKSLLVQWTNFVPEGNPELHYWHRFHATLINSGAGATLRGLLVEPLAAPGLELLVGLTRDPGFGPIVLVGLGGVLAEALDDVVLALAPVGRQEALAMLDGLRGRRLLDGLRGVPAIDRDAVAGIVVAVARLGVDRPDIVEIDLNPVMASAAGAVVVDALVVTAP